MCQLAANGVRWGMWKAGACSQSAPDPKNELLADANLSVETRAHAAPNARKCPVNVFLMCSHAWKAHGRCPQRNPHGTRCSRGVCQDLDTTKSRSGAMDFQYFVSLFGALPPHRVLPLGCCSRWVMLMRALAVVFIFIKKFPTIFFNQSR